MEYFIIESRYEVRTLIGVEFTNWFAYNTTKMTQEEAEEKINFFKENFDYIDKKTKLKHEYRLTSYDEYVANMDKIRNNVVKLNKKQAEYKKSNAYKELQKKKRQEAKERKEHQAKYIEEHTKVNN